MNNNTDLVVFGTFGQPNGFRQSSIQKKNYKTFDLNTNAIKVFPNNMLYSIRKENISGINTLAFSLYTFAKERNSDRSGTFIGSSIVFHNQSAEESLIMNCLNEFHKDLINNKKNVDNNVIQVEHSNKLQANKPKDFDKLSFNTKNFSEINFSPIGKDLVVYYEKADIEILRKSQELLNVYDTIYFTDSREIGKFVQEKQLIQIVDKNGFLQEIEKYRIQKEEQRKRKLKDTIDKIERETNNLEEVKKQLLENNKKRIESAKNTQQENQSQIKKFEKDLSDNQLNIQKAENQLIVISQEFDKYKKQLDSVKQKLGSETIQPEEVSKYLSEYQSKLEEAKKQLTIPDIRKIGSQTQPFQQQNFEYYSYGEKKSHKRHSEKTPPNVTSYQIIILIFILLWIGTTIYFLFVKEPEKIEVSTNYEEETLQETEESLSPKPNDSLNKSDYQLVAKELRYNMNIERVVDIIFRTNKEDIDSTYSAQKDLYVKKLKEMNPDCFGKDDSADYFVKDTLRNIPSYKIQE